MNTCYGWELNQLLFYLLAIIGMSAHKESLKMILRGMVAYWNFITINNRRNITNETNNNTTNR